MSGPTNRLYLDEAQELGFDLVKDRGYPKLDDAEKAILGNVAQGLCVSFAALAWAYDDAARGDDSGWKRLRERLLSRPVRVIKDGNGDDISRG